MNKMNTLMTLRRGAMALALSALAGMASAATYHIELNTASFVSTYGSTGWIDLQFNPGNSNTPVAAVTLTDFIGFGDAASAQLNGAVSGSLASGYTIANTDASGWNDLFHAVNFGGTVGFNVTFSGDADPGQGGNQSTFAVGLMNADADTYLGTTDISGSLVQLNWTASLVANQGSVTAAPLLEAPSIPALAAPVPEPETWAMMAAGLALLGLVRRRKQVS
jgi:hypothetical protein